MMIQNPFYAAELLLVTGKQFRWRIFYIRYVFGHM